MRVLVYERQTSYKYYLSFKHLGNNNIYCSYLIEIRISGKARNAYKNGKYKKRRDTIRTIPTEKLEMEGIIITPDREREQRINDIVQLMKSKNGSFVELVNERTAAELIGEGRER